jgi:hypothetical protein
MTESTTPPPAAAKKKPRRLLVLILLGIIVVPAVIFSLWAWSTLGYAYSISKKAGYVQKLSKKGWLCKTWEGELAVANLPETRLEVFPFTVRNDSIAALIEKSAGKRVSLTYEEHRGVPTSCFGETEFFVTGVGLAGP